MNRYRLYFSALLVAQLISSSGCSIFGEKDVVESGTLGSMTLENQIAADMPTAPAALPQIAPMPSATHQEIVSNYQRVLKITTDPLIRVNLQQRLAELEMIKSEELEAALGQLDEDIEIADSGSMDADALASDTTNTPVINTPATDAAPIAANLAQMDQPVNTSTAADIAPEPPAGYINQYTSYTDTIDAYVALLKVYPDRPNNDTIMYQLAKAYELDTQLEEAIAVLIQLTEQFPESVHWVESQFRIAEFLFSDIQYKRAEAAYLSIVSHPDASTFYQNSIYMLGWSQFKQELYNPALDSFISLLDHRFEKEAPGATIDPATQQQLSDVLRVMSWIFSEQGGSTAVATLLNKAGQKSYEHLLYSRLATEYLAKSRYMDTASTYQAYIDKYPNNTYSAIYSGLKVDAYLAGSFLALAFDEKVSFVKQYGFLLAGNENKSDSKNDSELQNRSAVHNEQQDTQVRLKQYVHELATHFHAIAQKAKEKTQRVEHYGKAIHYYQKFVVLFPKADTTPAAYYFLADALYKTGEYSTAIEAYEQSAYQYPIEEHSADAGYGAIDSYRKWLAALSKQTDPKQTAPKQTNIEQRSDIIDSKIESQLRFSETFADDKRVPAVLSKTIEELFAKNRYQPTIEVANRLLGLPHKRTQSKQRYVAKNVIAHSLFALEQYPEAEKAYLALRNASGSKSKKYQKLNEQFAASIYKQAEHALTQNQNSQAIEHFLRIVKLAPNSTIRSTAQYDAIVQMVAADQWKPATKQLIDFRRRFPSNALNANTLQLLITAFQKQERWLEAANELVKLFKRSTDVKEKQATLFLAAQTYEKAKQSDLAIQYYRQYAHAYPAPLDDALESRHKLEQLYLAKGEDSKRRYWLNKIIKLDRSTKVTDRTDRSRYLAAQASLVFAEDARVGFAQIKLRLPLRKNLSKKKKLFDKAISKYNKVVEYQVAEFTTIAHYKMGSIYQQLSADLIDSQRPPNLNELENEQYEMLLEEQAYPFEEEAISLHEANAKRSWDGIYDKGVQGSFDSLSKLLPARYNKHEAVISYSDEIL